MKASEMLHILKTQNKRMFIVWLVTFIAFVGLLGYTIYLLNDIGTIETTTEVKQSDAENNNYIGNSGEIINGSNNKNNN